MASTQKKAQEEERTIDFCDQSGFYLLPFLCRTWAPKGQTPILREYLTHAHLSLMSGITPKGEIIVRKQKQSFKGTHVVTFLKQLLRRIEGKLLIIWDRSPIHRSKAVKNFLTKGASKRIHLEMLPAYAPQLNPDEGVWRYLKTVELKNVITPNLYCLHYELDKALLRVKRKPKIIQSFFQHAGCYF